MKNVLTGNKNCIIEGLTPVISTGLKAILGVGQGEELKNAKKIYKLLIDTSPLSIPQ